jgi:hypothetical protein
MRLEEALTAWPQHLLNVLFWTPERLVWLLAMCVLLHNFGSGQLAHIVASQLRAQGKQVG